MKTLTPTTEPEVAPKNAAIEPGANGGAPSTPPAPKIELRKSHPVMRQIFRVFDVLEKPIEWLIRVCGWSSIIGIIAIFVFIFKEAAPMIPKLDWHLFFTSTRWI